MKEKFLPAGTVVLLKGGKKRLMITGFYVMDGETKNKIYDYCGCLYPEGMVSADKNALFNHEQIDKIYYMGYIDEEEKQFKFKLNEALKKQNSSTENKINVVSQTMQTEQPQPNGMFNTLNLDQNNQ